MSKKITLMHFAGKVSKTRAFSGGNIATQLRWVKEESWQMRANVPSLASLTTSRAPLYGISE